MAKESAKQSSNRPIWSQKRKGVHVSVFKNVSEKDGSTFFKTTVGKVYKDKDTGEFKTVTSFGATDIAVLRLLLAKAFDFVTEAEGDANKGEQE